MQVMAHDFIDVKLQLIKRGTMILMSFLCNKSCVQAKVDDSVQCVR